MTHTGKLWSLTLTLTLALTLTRTGKLGCTGVLTTYYLLPTSYFLLPTYYLLLTTGKLGCTGDGAARDNRLLRVGL